MAGAHDVIVTFADGSGKVVQSEIGDADDTANNMVTWKNTGSEGFFHVRQNCFITDVVSTDTGTNCTRYQLFINGKDVGIQLIIANCQTSVYERVKSPIGVIRAGSMIQIKQLA